MNGGVFYPSSEARKLLINLMRYRRYAKEAQTLCGAHAEAAK